MVTFTDWAVEVLARADDAARRLNPDARLRLRMREDVLEATLVDEPVDDDREARVGDRTVLVAAGVEGLVDVEAPHDRLVLRPSGAVPNERP